MPERQLEPGIGCAMNRRTKKLSPQDTEALAHAHRALEHPSYAARVSSMLGIPFEQGLKLLPSNWHDGLHSAAEAAIAKALKIAITSLGSSPPGGAHDDLHRGLILATGALGGFFGLPALLIELPLTTIILLRSIADVAHSHGEDLQTVETQLACLEVFAVGGRSHEDDYAEIGYYEVRCGLALHFSNAAKQLTEHGVTAETLPATVNFIRAIAARFGIVISDKAAAQLIPVVGAAAGALINAIFMSYFQNVAQGHFTLRGLERKYGVKTIESVYRRISTEEGRRKPRRQSNWT